MFPATNLSNPSVSQQQLELHQELQDHSFSPPAYNNKLSGNHIIFWSPSPPQNLLWTENMTHDLRPFGWSNSCDLWQWHRSSVMLRRWERNWKRPRERWAEIQQRHGGRLSTTGHTHTHTHTVSPGAAWFMLSSLVIRTSRTWTRGSRLDSGLNRKRLSQVQHRSHTQRQ